METRNFALTGLEVRAKVENDTGSKIARGYAAVFNSDSHDLGGFVERIDPGAFATSLTRAASGEANIFALWAHDTSLPLGSVNGKRLTLSEDERGLAFELDTLRFSSAQLGALEDNDLRMSFGFIVRDQEWRDLDDGSVIRTLKEVELLEVSFVINPAYPATDAALRSLSDWRSTQAVAVAERAEARALEAEAGVIVEKYNSTTLIKRALLARLRATSRE